MALIPFLGAAVGGGLSILDNIIGKDKLKRIREKEVDEALRQNLMNRQMELARSPEANRIAKAMNLQQGRAGSVAQAANIGGANAANSGFGGDVSSEAVAGIKAAAPVMQASAPYDQALAGTYSEMAQEQAQREQILDQNTMQRGQLAEMTAYTNEAGSNPFFDLVNSMAKGANQFTNIADMFITDKSAGEVLEPVPVPEEIPLPPGMGAAGTPSLPPMPDMSNVANVQNMTGMPGQNKTANSKTPWWYGHYMNKGLPINPLDRFMQGIR